MSQCIVPNWNLRHQRQEQVEGEEGNRSSHVQSDQNLSYVVPMSNYEVTELTWENGQLGLHGLGGIPPPPPHAQAPQTKQTWSKPGDTLESIVHQATFSPHAAGKWGENSTSHMLMEQNQQGNNLSSMAAPSSNGKWRENNSSTNHMHLEQNPESLISMAATSSAGKWRDNGGMTVKVNSINPTSSGGKWRENSQKGVKLSSMASSSGGKSCGENTSASGNLVNKRVRSESKHFQVEESACASASATFCRDTDTTMMTWANSFESPRSLKDARNRDDDSAYQDFSENQDGERMTKEESFRSQSSARRSRAATVHNQSERRRRDRINEKMKALQKLVPNASKTDKASMLEEVIEYLKQLQSQVQMMSNARNVNMPQMVMPLGMQQQLHQMSILARMGMGMGMGMDMGMLDVARNVPHSFPQLIHGGGGAAPSFVSPPFAMPPVIPPHTNQLKPNINAATMTTSVPSFNDAYNTFIAQQSMNMDFLNKMSALYRQQGNQLPKKPVSSSMPANHGQGV